MTETVSPCRRAPRLLSAAARATSAERSLWYSAAFASTMAASVPLDFAVAAA